MEPTASKPQSPEGSETANPQVLESALVQLLAAENRTAYAARHGIAYSDGTVRVVIQLREGTTMPSGHGISVAIRDENSILASVPVSNLAGLSTHRNVTAIRLPEQPQPLDQDPAVEPTAEQSATQATLDR